MLKLIAAIGLACTSEPATVTITVKPTTEVVAPSSEAVAIIHEHCQAVASGKTEISLNHFTKLCGVVVATDAQVELHQALEQQVKAGDARRAWRTARKLAREILA